MQKKIRVRRSSAIKYKKRRKRNILLTSLFVIAVVATVVMLAINFIAMREYDLLSVISQNSQSSKASSSLTASASDSSSEVSSSSLPPSQSVEESSKSSVTSEQTDDAVGEAEPESPNYILSETEAVSGDYFANTAFVGDSITKGMRLYPFMKESTIIAENGLNPQTIFVSTALVDSNNKEFTALEALGIEKPEKIYIMLGSNGIAWLGVDVMINNYDTLIDGIKLQHPNSTIIVQSMFPVTEEKAESEPAFALKKIKEYNAELKKLAISKEVYFLDSYAALAGEDGYLPAEASPTDGMHFGQKYYEEWFYYIATHTVEKQ